jgi:hypothetical protein
MTCQIISYCSLPTQAPLNISLTKTQTGKKFVLSRTLKEIKSLVEKHFNLEPNSYFLCSSSCFIPSQARIGKETEFASIDTAEGLSVFPQPPVDEKQESDRMSFSSINFCLLGETSSIQLHFSPCSTLAEIFFQIVQNYKGKVCSQTPFELLVPSSNRNFKILPSMLFKNYHRQIANKVLIYTPVIETQQTPETSETNDRTETTEQRQETILPTTTPTLTSSKKRKTFEELEEEIQSLQTKCRKVEERANKFEQLYNLEQKKVESLLSSSL